MKKTLKKNFKKDISKKYTLKKYKINQHKHINNIIKYNVQTPSPEDQFCHTLKKNVNKTKKNRKNQNNNTKKNQKINGILEGSLEIKNNNHYIKFNDNMINYQYDIKLNNLSNEIEKQLYKQISFKDWVLELEMEDKVILEWISKENNKIKLPKITYFHFNNYKYRIIWNTNNLKYI